MRRAKRKGRLQAVEPGIDHGEREGGPGDVRIRTAVGTHPKEGHHLPERIYRGSQSSQRIHTTTRLRERGSRAGGVETYLGDEDRGLDRAHHGVSREAHGQFGYPVVPAVHRPPELPRVGVRRSPVDERLFLCFFRGDGFVVIIDFFEAGIAGLFQRVDQWWTTPFRTHAYLPGPRQRKCRT